jgi:hypothetical protein
MASKADFNAEEWTTIVEGPVLAGMRVVTAGRGGTIRESLAIGKVYGEARRAHGESPLLDELVSSPPGVDPQRVGGEGDLGAASAERLREALRLLGEKGAPEDVEAYKRFVLSVARAAAEAHKEGGFVGIGGRQISEDEQRALDEIEAVLESGSGGAPPSAA